MVCVDTALCSSLIHCGLSRQGGLGTSIWPKDTLEHGMGEMGIETELSD